MTRSIDMALSRSGRLRVITVVCGWGRSTRTRSFSGTVRHYLTVCQVTTARGSFGGRYLSAMPERLSLEDAAALVQPLDTLAIPLGPGQPTGFIHALAQRESYDDL